VVIWYIFSRFGILYREKSGNPAPATAASVGAAFSFSVCPSVRSLAAFMLPTTCGSQISQHVTFTKVGGGTFFSLGFGFQRNAVETVLRSRYDLPIWT
jgi:hypothetical protein